ncbi:hypothetical protein NDU88_002439 [Pleurodeles waltl]|uniref:Uncharacterized protein n=1 Tax=Pleurodeles waltl TaxID=8319 RepID=A0AAV7M2G1_PLEWA|nr:hypothetical protein NDU88_002439 [Pleurodeles waltl]
MPHGFLHRGPADCRRRQISVSTLAHSPSGALFRHNDSPFTSLPVGPRPHTPFYAALQTRRESHQTSAGPISQLEPQDSQARCLGLQPPLLPRFSSAPPMPSVREDTHEPGPEFASRTGPAPPAITGPRPRRRPLPSCGPSHQTQSPPPFRGPPSPTAGARQVRASFYGRAPTIVAGLRFVLDDGEVRTTLRVRPPF